MLLRCMLKFKRLECGSDDVTQYNTISADDSRNKFVARPARLIFGTAGFAEHSNCPAVAFNHCLAAERIMQLGKLKFRKTDCCLI